jgi:GTP pyrophosphokinase
MSLILKAYQFAADKHAGQVRKVTGIDYISHPIAVSYIVAAFKKSKKLDELIAAAILHDVLEDTDATFVEIASMFTPLVASLALELKSDKDEIAVIGKTEYLKKKLCGISNYGLLLKLADRLHNMSDHPTDLMKKSTIEIIEYVQRIRKLTKSQLAIAQEILRVCR